MRVRRSHDGLTIQATAGTYVVMLGMNMDEADCPGLRGFAIHRRDHEAEEANWMSGLKTFEATDPGFAAGAKYSTREHSIQGSPGRTLPPNRVATTPVAFSPSRAIRRI